MGVENDFIEPYCGVCRLLWMSVKNVLTYSVVISEDLCFLKLYRCNCNFSGMLAGIKNSDIF